MLDPDTERAFEVGDVVMYAGEPSRLGDLVEMVRDGGGLWVKVTWRAVTSTEHIGDLRLVEPE